MKVYRPVPLDTVTDAPALAPRHDAIERIGIVDDKLDPHLIDGVVDQLRALLPHASVKVWTKPTGTSPAPDSLIEEMAREVQVALAGVGM
ncbi:MAG TPA: hypothetical protein VGQ20_11280 [Acidimicrobiales bacterium]|nr:hypothetical protein [Acidimicrobiales bacterium]